MNPTLNLTIQDLDTVALTHDLPEQGLKQGDMGAVVHCYANGEAFEVEFVNVAGQTTALATLTAIDIQPVYPYTTTTLPMASESKVTMNFNGPVYGAAGNVERDQIVTVPPSPQPEAIVADLQILLTQLHSQYPQVANEAEAAAIIEAEFTEIQQSPTHKLAALRQQLLNPEWQGK